MPKLKNSMENKMFLVISQTDGSIKKTINISKKQIEDCHEGLLDIIDISIPNKPYGYYQEDWYEVGDA